jgi:LmbE family N-acetylglucosaminyl deacetylase
MNILILSPHTDDAEIGAGATISKFIQDGHNLLWVVFSTCEESLPPHLNKDTLKNEFMDVATFLGVESITYDYKVRKLDEHRQDILEHLREIKEEFAPELVIGPSLNDFHQDHRVVANEMVRAFKTSASIICYELPWNHVEFKTQMFVVFSRQELESKIHLVNFYKSQMSMRTLYFSQDLIRSLAVVRGSQINSEYAEAFEVIRWIIKSTIKEEPGDTPTFCL